ncbi:pyrethroid hydrolase Ces2a-like, partial [Plectropomus leopardus]|uniref:pyrethroid hydrolase Ces2a-like n=1 Tax=Plectropomus leopardus TaxID=160734 RepID=UPI001C4DA4C2
MRTALLIVYLLPALTAIAQATPGSVDPVVSLKNGRIRGGYITAKGTERRVKQYLRIPFARPPVGPLRWTAPLDAQPWEGERDGTQQPPMCIQNPQIVVDVSRTMSMHYTPPELSEDCLYLNVYTPAEAAKGDKLP